MINGQREIWISTGNKSNYRATIIAVSNCGRIMRKNGKIEIASYGQHVFVGEKRLQMRVYHFLANNFIVKTEDDILKQRNVIDHITHTPDNMHINDVRNLRWCTQKENCNFKEAKRNYSKAKKGMKFTAEHRAKMSAAKKGNTNAKGKRSEEVKEKMSAAKKGNTNAKGNTNVRGRHWYNNGVSSVLTYECPPGFTIGRI
jgi:hypothetical protein